MAARDELIAVWTAGKPANATGSTFASNAPAETKITAINGWTVPKGSANQAILEPTKILNTIKATDLAALTQLQVLQLTLLLSGNSVDASQGTNVRAGVQAIFSGKTETLQALSALVAPYDNPSIPWWQSVGFQSPVALGDAIAAGLS